MKFIKIIFLLAAILFGVWIVLCLMGPKSFSTSRSVEINASPEVIYPIFADLSEWKAWSPWQNRDSTMVTTLSAVTTGVDAEMRWTSENMGDGSMRIVEVVENERVSTALSFSDWDNESYSDLMLKPQNGTTELIWTMEAGDLPFLARGFMVLLSPIDAIHDDYDYGLAEVKKIAEERQVSFDREQQRKLETEETEELESSEGGTDEAPVTADLEVLTP